MTIHININSKEAARYIKISADYENIDSMYKYGLMLLGGKYVKKDEKEAAKYFKKAADKK